MKVRDSVSAGRVLNAGGEDLEASRAHGFCGIHHYLVTATVVRAQAQGSALKINVSRVRMMRRLEGRSCSVNAGCWVQDGEWLC